MKFDKEDGAALYIDVAVALPVHATYTYQVPQSLLASVSVGKRVLVPFGPRRVTGYVLGQVPPNYQVDTKLILDVLDTTPLFPATMMPLFNWAAGYYLYPLGQVIAASLPGGLTLSEKNYLVITDAGQQALRKPPAQGLEREILIRLAKGPCRKRDLKKGIGMEVPGALIHLLEKRGWLVRERRLAGGRTRPKTERFIRRENLDLPLETLSAARRKVLAALGDGEAMSLKSLRARVPRAGNVIGPLSQAGYIRIFEKSIYRDPFDEPISPDTPPTLTQEQQQAVDRVVASLGQGYGAFLLAGVTGSGKTEVYMQAAAAAISQGRSVVVLVPEIALITQMEHRFRARFGDCVALLHSGLSPGERYDQWCRILNRDATIAIGARSAVFAPFDQVGLIIVDEEHDSSYKQESHLRYNARDLAVVRAKQQNGVVLLGSATPSLQSYYNVKIRKFVELRLNRRIENRPLAQIAVVDLRESRDMRGVRRFITPALQREMERTLSRDEQVLLFLNRRGFASFPVCANCGQPVRCMNCDITLTHHRQARAFKCHHCGYSRAAASTCPACGSDKIKLLGIGTEKVEAAAQELFPGARVARLDRDTTIRKGVVVKILKGLKNRSIDILVGTQMIAKGHDFPHITLVGIICADQSLSFPDFRSGERTFQLLAQVSGRAGRGDSPGRVILQTYSPEHFSIQAAQKQNFRAFYKKELPFRQALGYPPFSRMAQVKISGKDREKTTEAARQLGKRGRHLLHSDPSFSRTIEFMGPIEAPLPKIASRYRWQILLKGKEIGPLHRFLTQLAFGGGSGSPGPGIRMVVDVDPFFML